MQSAVHTHGPQKAAKRGVLKVGPEQLRFSVHQELKIRPNLRGEFSAVKCSVRSENSMYHRLFHAHCKFDRRVELHAGMRPYMRAPYGVLLIAVDSV